MLILDIVYDEIREQLASFAPERGGALYGVPGYPCVTHFEYDDAAVTTGATYVPSAQLIGNVRRVESTTGLAFKGIVHSHPAGIDRPSGQDEWAAAKFFELNPHHSQMALPIVQQLGACLDDPARFLHWYRAERARERSFPFRRASPRSAAGVGFGRTPVAIVQEDFHVVPLHEHVRWLAAEVTRRTGRDLDVARDVQPLQLHGADLCGLVASGADDVEFLYFASLAYPVVAPVVLYRHGEDTCSLRFEWDGTADVAPSLERVASALAAQWHTVPPAGSRDRRLADSCSSPGKEATWQSI